MRAPPESLMPTTGAPLRMAMSMILQIFWACVSDSEPPKTVKSWENT
jgi:heme A synthase